MIIFLYSKKLPERMLVDSVQHNVKRRKKKKFNNGKINSKMARNTWTSVIILNMYNPKTVLQKQFFTPHASQVL